MGYRCLFMNNDIYTAQDVNDAISSVISGGVSNYPLGVNALADLNSAISQITGAGTQLMDDSCKVVNNNGTYKILAGSCFLDDGSQIVFDSDGYNITHQSGVYEYVYLKRDVLHNTINVVVDTEAAASGDMTAALAEIKADGTVLDRRRFARAKISLTTEPQNMCITKHIETANSLPHGYSFDVELGFNGWKYILFELTNASGYVSAGCIELADGESTRRFPIRNTDGYYDGNNLVTRNGSVLHFENTHAINASNGFNVDIEVR